MIQYYLCMYVRIYSIVPQKPETRYHYFITTLRYRTSTLRYVMVVKNHSHHFFNFIITVDY